MIYNTYYICGIYYIYGFSTSSFSEWKGAVSCDISNFWKNEPSLNLRNNSLSLQDEIIKELKMLHYKFVVIPNGKASGNVYQRNYAQALIKELDLNNVNNILSTYR